MIHLHMARGHGRWGGGNNVKARKHMGVCCKGISHRNGWIKKVEQWSCKWTCQCWRGKCAGEV